MRAYLLATTGIFAAFGAHAQTIQSGNIGGMPYQVLMPSQPCTAAAPCSVVTYLGYQDSSVADATRDLQNYFATSAFQSASHSIVIAPTIPGAQDSVVNWGGYNTLTTPQQTQMVAMVKGVEAQMGNTVNPVDSVVTGGSLGGNGTQAALIAYGPKGTVQPGVFSAGLSFDAATYAAAGNGADAAALCGVPLTAVHGVDDSNQSISYDTALASAINGNPACGNSFKLVPVANAGHGTWSGPSGYTAGVGPGTPLGGLTAQLNNPSPAAVVQQPTIAAVTPAAGNVVVPTGTPQAPATAAAAASTEITPDSGSLIDCSGHSWMITASGSIMEGETYTPGGGGTSALAIVKHGSACTVYGKDSGRNGGGWFTLSGDGQAWSPSSPPDNAAPVVMATPSPTTPSPQLATLPPPVGQCATDSTPTGIFHVAGGQIIGPDGKPFIARGLNLYDLQMGSGGQMTADFKGLNFIRVNIHSYQSPSAYQGFISEMTGAGRVVEFEDHPDGGGGQDAGPPGGMGAESSWYAAMAEAYKGNPYVWFGTFNEPMPSGGLSAWHQATYNAIRGTGNQNPILIEPGGSRPNNLTAALNLSVYLSMSNIVIDPHVYGYQNNYSSDQASLDANAEGMITAAQTIKTADGTPAVIIGEYGPSTTGSDEDPNGMAVVGTIITMGSNGRAGSAAWAYDPGGPGDHVTNGGQITVPYGQTVQLFVNTDVVAPSQCQQNQQAQQAVAAVRTSLQGPAQ